MKWMSNWTEKEKLVSKGGLIIVVGIWVIIGIDLYILENMGVTASLKSGSVSLLAGCRTLLSIFFFICFFPGAILVEFVDSYGKKRSFRPRNVPLMLMFFAEAVFVGIALLTLFDLSFSSYSLLIQIPLVSLGLGVPTVVVAANVRIRKVNDYMKRAFGQ